MKCSKEASEKIIVGAAAITLLAYKVRMAETQK